MIRDNYNHFLNKDDLELVIVDDGKQSLIKEFCDLDNILYLHLDNTDHLSEGEWLDVGDFLGNPSCEGGNSTGTHIHFARKYNGEWITAGGAIPMNLGGWVVEAGNEPYEGFLNRGNERIKSCICGAFYTQIIREISDP